MIQGKRDQRETKREETHAAATTCHVMTPPTHATRPTLYNLSDGHRSTQRGMREKEGLNERERIKENGTSEKERGELCERDELKEKSQRSEKRE